jgi:hypothetical protein
VRRRAMGVLRSCRMNHQQTRQRNQYESQTSPRHERSKTSSLPEDAISDEGAAIVWHARNKFHSARPWNRPFA